MSAPSAKLRAVVDTNVFVSGTIGLLGVSRRLLQMWYANDFVLVLSERQYAELTDVFTRPKLLARVRVPFDELTKLRTGLATSERIPLRSDLPLVVRDPKDEHLLAAALDGGADYLVSRDNDLLVLRDDPRLGKVQIVTVAEFLTILTG